MLSGWLITAVHVIERFAKLLSPPCCTAARQLWADTHAAPASATTSVNDGNGLKLLLT